MKKRVFLLLAATAGLAALIACGPAPTPAPPSKEPAETPKQAPQPEGPVDAQTAFYEMYKPARTWAPDLQPLSLIAGEIPGMENSGGKAGMWTAVFVSPGRHEARTFVYGRPTTAATSTRASQRAARNPGPAPRPRAVRFKSPISR